jgi:murein DD-endopeptidase MepM/ murein hydrolase activator NlpD
VPSIDIIEMANAAKPVKSLSKLKPGTRFYVELDKDNNLLGAQFRFSAVERLVLKKDQEGWRAESLREKIDVKNVSFVGEVRSTLWESAIDAAMDPYLISEMAEIFGWEIDFSRQVRQGDRWRLTAEELFVKDQHVGWGAILAAEYINQGEVHSAILFREGDENLGYFSAGGDNLRKMFLKSPLKYGRVTSRFNRRRFHPVLKRIRPHNGVDYGVPVGTPVRSVADGVVQLAGRRGGGGKTLKIRHNSIYQTAYKHLSGYARGIRRGAKVKQGQIVAYSGNTGLSTGPHLHYELYKNGRYVDPLRQEFPSAKPLSSEKKAQFLRQSKKFVALLPGWKSKKLDMNPEKSWSEYLVHTIQNDLELTIGPEKFVYRRPADEEIEEF